MPHFNRTRPEGTWVTGTPVYATELDDFDTKISKAINGDEGGVWAPTGDTSIGGFKTWTFTCLVRFTNTVVFTDDVGISGSLSYELLSGGDIFCGSVQSGGDVSASGQVACDNLFCANGATFGAIQTPTGGHANIGGNCTVAGTFQAGASTVANLTCSGASQFGGTVTHNGQTNLYGPTRARKPITCEQEGRVTVRVGKVTTDANQQFSVADVSFVRIPNGVISTPRIIDLLATGANEGDEMRVFSEDFTNHVTVRDAASLDILIQLKNASGFSRAVDVVYTDGAWRISMNGRVAA